MRQTHVPALAAVALLSAFAPPSNVQQQPPKSWIPEPGEKLPSADFYVWEWEEETGAGKTVRPNLPPGDYLGDEDLPKECFSPRPSDGNVQRSPGLILPTELLRQRCAKRPPEAAAPLQVRCVVLSTAGQIAIAKPELEKPLRDADWLMQKELYTEARKTIDRAAAVSTRPEEHFAVASTRLKLARTTGDRRAELLALQAQVETGCLDDLNADIARSNINYLQNLIEAPR